MNQPTISIHYGSPVPYTDGQEILLLDSDIVFDPQIVEKLLHSDKGRHIGTESS